MARITHGVDSEETYLTALVFCEKVITDRETGSSTLVSAFNTIEFVAFPSRSPRFSIYLALARGHSDEREFYVGITAPDGEVVMRGGFTIDDWGDALTSEMVLTMSEMPLPTAGLYVVRVFVADRVLEVGQSLLQPTCPNVFFGFHRRCQPLDGGRHLGLWDKPAIKPPCSG